MAHNSVCRFRSIIPMSINLNRISSVVYCLFPGSDLARDGGTVETRLRLIDV